MRKVLLHICWTLEDIMDFITHHHAYWFYPSFYFESFEHLKKLQRLYNEEKRRERHARPCD